MTRTVTTAPALAGERQLPVVPSGQLRDLGEEGEGGSSPPPTGHAPQQVLLDPPDGTVVDRALELLIEPLHVALQPSDVVPNVRLDGLPSGVQPRLFYGQYPDHLPPFHHQSLERLRLSIAQLARHGLYRFGEPSHAGPSNRFREPPRRQSHSST